MDTQPINRLETFKRKTHLQKSYSVRTFGPDQLIGLSEALSHKPYEYTIKCKSAGGGQLLVLPLGLIWNNIVADDKELLK